MLNALYTVSCCIVRKHRYVIIPISQTEAPRVSPRLPQAVARVGPGLERRCGSFRGPGRK